MGGTVQHSAEERAPEAAGDHISTTSQEALLIFQAQKLNHEAEVLISQNNNGATGWNSIIGAPRMHLENVFEEGPR